MRLFFPRMLNPFLYKDRVSKSGIANLNISSQTKAMKPPNILLYCPGRNSEKIGKAVKVIDSLVSQDSYVVYSISSQKLILDPWLENVSGLIVYPQNGIDETVLRESKDKIQEFINSGGNVLSFSSRFLDGIKTKKSISIDSQSLKIISPQNQAEFEIESSLLNGSILPETLNTNAQVILEASVNENTSVVCIAQKSNNSRILLCMLDLLKGNKYKEEKLLSHLLHLIGIEVKGNNKSGNSISEFGYLYTSSAQHQINIMTSLEKNIWNENELKILHLKIDSTIWDQKNGDEDFFKVICSRNTSNFDEKTYFDNLKCKYLGQAVIYMDIINSTMSVLDGVIHKLPKESGAVVIAKQQTQGQGRGGNKWLSPMGCSMFTSTLHIPIQSKLGSRLPFIQHLVAVAVVHSLRSIPQLKDVDLRVKWPNDIYFGKSIKLGGVIVKSSVYRDMCICSIGCGVNLSNAKPTVCINDIIKDKYFIDCNLSSEKLIARVLTHLEEFVNEFQANGPDDFLQLYYRYWMHKLTEIKFEDRSMTSQTALIDATIVGLDRHGYLRVRRHDNGVVVSLHPDGNSFDILKNLIVSKSSSFCDV